MIVICFCGEKIIVDDPLDMLICPKCLLFHDDLLPREALGEPYEARLMDDDEPLPGEDG